MSSTPADLASIEELKLVYNEMFQARAHPTSNLRREYSDAVFKCFP